MKLNKLYLPIYILLFLFYSVESFAANKFTPNSQPTGWLARPTASNSILTSGTETFYQLNYDKDLWSGDVLARLINQNAIVQGTGPWNAENPVQTGAAPFLDNVNYDTGRKIITMNGSSKIAFRWNSLSTAQQKSIDVDPALGQKMLNYIRGDRTNELSNAGKLFRDRKHVMGDILHSTINYWKHSNTVKRLYVGANDGMLHVLNADTGDVIYSYIPSMLIPRLNLLTANPYVHQHFVDAPISIANVDFSGTVKTLLVGGLGAGGQGLYALDITEDPANPSATASEFLLANKIKWEITPASTGFANLGNTYGTPRIARLNNGVAAVIIGNGYVNKGDGHAWLYIININNGSLIRAIDTGSGSTTLPSGLSTPTLFDSNSDGKVDYVYAGDIDGKLWKFDLRSTNPSNFSSSLLFTTSPSRAITTAPAVTNHPSGGRMVAFATGRILGSVDTSVDPKNVNDAVYGIWDGAPGSPPTIADLLVQTFIPATYTEGKNTASPKIVSVRSITAKTPNWTIHKGWKLDLPLGERVVGELPFYSKGRFVFLSTNPTTVNASLPNGENWVNEIAFLSGSSAFVDPIFDLNKDNIFDSGDFIDDPNTTSGKCIPSKTNVMPIVTCKPVSKYLGSGVFSQPTSIFATSYGTTLYTSHPDLAMTNGKVVLPKDPGVSGGHFDFDIYYYANPGAISTITTPTASSQTKTLCDATANVAAEYNKVSNVYCNTANGFSTGYTYLSAYTTGNSCGGTATAPPPANNTSTTTICEKEDKVKKEIGNKYKKCPNKDEILISYTLGNKCDKIEKKAKDQKYDITLVCESKSGSGTPPAPAPKLNQTITCSTTTSTTVTSASTNYANVKHVHQYDDIYDVTGVNMLNASLPTFNLVNAITDPTVAFKVLVMNQYLSPAATLSVGGKPYENVKTYGNLASETNATTLINSLPVYTRNDIKTLIFNLPIDAFKSKNWWGDNGVLRAGLIPTQTGCVHDVNPDGSIGGSKGKSKVGPNGERFNGALTFQLIKANTPASALELNHSGGDVKYGWRVKQSVFSQYVLAEYTTFWHNPNKFCYGDTGWIPDAAQETGPSKATAKTPAAGSADPKDGIFSAGFAIVSELTVVSPDGNTTTITRIYSDGSKYIIVITKNSDGSVTTTQTFRDGTTTTVTTGLTNLKSTVDYTDPSKGAPQEKKQVESLGRQSWQQIR